MDFLNEFVLLLKARYPIIYISTSEEERIEYLIKYCAKKYLIRTYYCWDFVDGYQGNLNDVGFATKNPLEALELISKVTPNIAAIFVLKDYDNFLKDFTIVRRLKNLSRSLKTQTKNIVIVSSVVNIPESLKEFVTLIEFPLPTYVEILEELNRLLFSLQHEIKISTLRNIATASQGLSLERIRRVLSKIIAKNGEIDDSSANLILQEKKLVIQESQILEFCSKNKNILDLGGLDNFKDWVKLRYKAFSQDASLYGLPYPKGLLLVGVQGTGKSLAAGIIAHEWQLPLLRLDFGRLYASLIGQSEQRVRKTIEIAEALSPCVLWVDEIDKAFSGFQSHGDSGTTNRVLSTFLTWLSEKSSPVFVVATANNIDWIPSEILRKGRFDEMFFLNLPTCEERKSIFELHLKRHRPGSMQKFHLGLLGQLSKEFSGAEIEQVVIEAMRLGFHENREFSTEDILVSMQNLIPLARTKNKEIELLKIWSKSGNVTNASKYG